MRVEAEHDGDGIVRLRRRVVRDAEEVGDAPKGQVTGADAEFRLDLPGDIDGREDERGPVEHRSRGGDPRVVRLR